MLGFIQANPKYKSVSICRPIGFMVCKTTAQVV